MSAFRSAHFARVGRITVLLAALGVQFLPAGLGVVQAQEPAKAAPAEPEKLRAEFGPGVKAFDELLAKKDYKAALAKLVELEAIPNRTPLENFWILRSRVSAASLANDNELTMKAIEETLATGRMNGAESLAFYQEMVRLKYLGKDFKGTIEWIERFKKAGGDKDKLRELHLMSLYESKDDAKTLAMARQLIAEDIAAGKKPLQTHLAMVLNITNAMKDVPATNEALRQMVTYHPQRDNWESILSRYFSNTANADRFLPSYFRLKFFMGMMNEDVDFTNMAEVCLHAGQPGEAKRAMDLGYQNGLLGKGSDVKKHTAMRDRANKAAADDIKSLEQAEAAAGKAKEGTGLVNLGYALLVNGKADKGIALMEQGIKMSLKKPDEARMLLAIAYAQLGRKEEALKTFATVQSNDGGTELARLWTIYLNNPLPK